VITLTEDQKASLANSLDSTPYRVRTRDGIQTYSRLDNTPFTADDLLSVQVIVDSYDPLPDHKIAKNSEIKEEALSRINDVFPAINSIDDIHLISELWKSLIGAAKSPTTDMQAAINVYSAAKSAISDVNLMSVAGDVIGYDVINTPAWP